MTLTPLIPATAVSEVEVLNVLPALRLHHAADALLVARSHQQMNMIGHQHEGMDGHLVLQRSVLEHRQVRFVIRLRVKAGFAIVAALDYVLRTTRQKKAWQASA